MTINFISIDMRIDGFLIVFEKIRKTKNPEIGIPRGRR